MQQSGKAGTPVAYRPDIDGLRAIAVSSVVFYHAFPAVLTGGFIGVDIFFVISGFLITGIILREIIVSRFSFATFYARRIKRIFPALLLILAVTLMAGWYLLLVHEFRQLGKHVLGGIMFLSNVVLWLESGYFDTSSELKPLLHLWSLGVEEQFYIFWPVILILLIRLKINYILIPALVLLVSFLANIAFVSSHPTGSFYLPFTRFWELMVGGFFACVQVHCEHNPMRTWAVSARLKEALAAIGLIFLALGLLLTTAENPFPGWWAVLPVLGSVLLIAVGAESMLSRAVLGNRVMVYVGLISYPLYLWHWPLLTYARLTHGELPPVVDRLLLIVVMVLLASATYHFIEKPLKRVGRRHVYYRVLLGSLVAGSMVVGLCGFAAWRGAVEPRLSFYDELDEAASDWVYPQDGGDPPPLVGSKSGVVLFLGDSYMQQLYPRIAKIAADPSGQHYTAEFVTHHGCPPIPRLNRKSEGHDMCAGVMDSAFSRAEKSDIVSVVVAGSWNGMLERNDIYDVADPSRKIVDFYDSANMDKYLKLTIDRLAALAMKGKQVYIVLNPVTDARANPFAIAMARFAEPSDGLPVKILPIEEYRRQTDRVNESIRRLAANTPVRIIDPSTWICEGDACYLTDPNGQPRFKDSSHYRASFVECCVTSFDAIVQGNEQKSGD